MFIRPRYRKKNGKRHAYWALVESYRTDRGPRQRVVAHLGQLKPSERLGVKHAAQGKRKSPYEQLRLCSITTTSPSPNESKSIPQTYEWKTNSISADRGWRSN
jgi:hypothetical protein